MERNLLWSAFGVGAAGWLCALALTGARPGEERSHGASASRVFLVAAAVLPIVLFLATLPSRPPFAAGHGFGDGFLVGAVGALLGFLLLTRARERATGPMERALLAAGPLFLAASAVSLVVLWMPHVVIDALVSLPIGWLATALILQRGVSSIDANTGHRTPDTGEVVRGREGSGHAPSTTHLLTSSAVFATTLAATVAIGVYRGSGTLEHLRWAATAALVGAGIPLAVVIAAIPGRLFGWLALKLPFAVALGRLAGAAAGDEGTRQLLVRAWRIALAVGVVLLLAWAAGSKILAQQMVLRVAGIGLAMGLLAWWLVRDAAEEVRSGGTDETDAPGGKSPAHPVTRSPVPAFGLASLVIVAGFMAAYRYLQGFGVGLALVSAWALTATALSGRSERSGTTDLDPPKPGSAAAMVGLLTLGAILVLFRLFQTRFSHELRGVGLTDDYAMAGVLVGAILPGLVSGLQTRSGGLPWLSLAGLALSGALLLIVPAAIVLLWGPKCALALFIGLALSAAAEGWRTAFSPADRAPGLTPLFALGAALAVTQWLAHALPLASLARAAKISVVGWSLVGLVVLILLVEYAGKLIAARQPGPAPAGARR